MDSFLGLLFLVGAVGIWYFIKKKPNKRHRNIAIGITVAAVALILIIPGGEDEEKASATGKEDKTEESSQPKLKVSMENEFQAGKDGKVEIEGKTSPEAKIMVAETAKNVLADGNGNFSFNYENTEPKDVKINMQIEKGKQKVKKSVTVKQNDDRKEAIKEEKAKAKKEKAEKEAKKKDIRELSKEPTNEQKVILDTLAQMQFEDQYPYKGSKIHSVLGVIQDWTENDGEWYYKAEATIVNGYGAEQGQNIEVHITPTAADAGNVRIINY